jgi:hypothetical protein
MTSDEQTNNLNNIAQKTGQLEFHTHAITIYYVHVAYKRAFDDIGNVIFSEESNVK